MKLSENTLLTALIMEKLAPATEVDARQAYTAGLLRSTGKIAIDRLARGGGATFLPGTLEGLAAWETAQVGMTDVEAAAMNLDHWRFPADTVEAIRDHYLEDGSVFPLTNLLNLAAGTAERLCHGLAVELSYWEQTSYKFSAAGMSAE